MKENRSHIAHRRIKEKDGKHTLADVVKQINESREGRGCYSGNTQKRLLYDYFSMIQSTILEGYAFEFPSGFGTLCVVKRKVKEEEKERYLEQLKKLSEKFLDGKHLNRFGEVYSIRFEGPCLSSKAFTFKASPSMRKALTKTLRETKKDYRTINLFP